MSNRIFLDLEANIVSISSSPILTHIISYLIFDLFGYLRFITEDNRVTRNWQHFSVLLKVFNGLLLNLITCCLPIKANNKNYYNNYCCSNSDSYKYSDIYRYLVRCYCWRVDQSECSIRLQNNISNSCLHGSCK